MGYNKRVFCFKVSHSYLIDNTEQKKIDKFFMALSARYYLELYRDPLKRALKVTNKTFNTFLLK